MGKAFCKVQNLKKIRCSLGESQQVCKPQLCQQLDILFSLSGSRLCLYVEEATVTHKQRVWLCAHKSSFVDPENHISYDFQGSQSILLFLFFNHLKMEKPLFTGLSFKIDGRTSCVDHNAEFSPKGYEKDGRRQRERKDLQSSVSQHSSFLQRHQILATSEYTIVYLIHIKQFNSCPFTYTYLF